MKHSMKRLAVILAVIALLSTSSITSASVWLNTTDYGSNLSGAISAARANDVVEFRADGSYTGSSYSIGGQNLMAYAGVTVQSAAGYRATISATDGAH